MNRSIAFAATSLSAILLVAATLTTAASAQEASRNIEISKTKFKTLSTITPGADTQEAEILPQSGKRQNRISTIDPGQEVSSIEPGQPVDQGGNQNASTDQPEFTSSIEPGETVNNGGIQDASAEQPEFFKSTIEPGANVDTGEFQDARAEVPVNPKAFTIDPREETSVPGIDNDDDKFADVEAPPAPKPKKKLPKVLQQEVDETEEAAEVPDLPIKPKKAVDAASSDDAEDEEEEIVTKEVEEKPAVETAETDEEEVAPSYNKKFRMRYSPSLRRYVQVTDEDIAYEAAEYQDDSYEVPTYRRSYSHGYGQRRNYNYLPSCEN